MLLGAKMNLNHRREDRQGLKRQMKTWAALMQNKEEKGGIQGEEKSVVGGLWENIGDKDIKARTARKALTKTRLPPDYSSALWRALWRPMRTHPKCMWKSGPLGPPESFHPLLLSHGQALLQKWSIWQLSLWTLGLWNLTRGFRVLVSLSIICSLKLHELISATHELAHCGQGVWVRSWLSS